MQYKYVGFNLQKNTYIYYSIKYIDEYLHVFMHYALWHCL